jgi:hypothetical protein
MQRIKLQKKEKLYWHMHVTQDRQILSNFATRSLVLPRQETFKCVHPYESSNSRISEPISTKFGIRKELVFMGYDAA